MALPWTFANATTLFTSRLDDDFNALGALVIIPCSASGTNTILLTTAANTPTVSAYTTYTPVFSFIAAASATSTVTVNINGIGTKNLYNNGGTQATTGNILVGATYWVAYDAALNSGNGGFVLVNPAVVLGTITIQRFITGSGTYTPTVGTQRIRVRMVGGGGGGGARATNAGNSVTASTASAFADWTANPGAGGGAGGVAAGLGGTTGTDGTGTLILRMPGGDGNPALTSTVANVVPAGANGGSNPLGGAGRGGVSAAGSNAKANSGGGGGGGSGVSTSSAGSGGGAGEYVEFFMTAAQIGTSKTYTVGVAGVGGAAGGLAGGDGGAGFIVVEEYPF